MKKRLAVTTISLITTLLLIASISIYLYSQNQPYKTYNNAGIWEIKYPREWKLNIEKISAKSNEYGLIFTQDNSKLIVREYGAPGLQPYVFSKKGFAALKKENCQMLETSEEKDNRQNNVKNEWLLCNSDVLNQMPEFKTTTTPPVDKIRREFILTTEYENEDEMSAINGYAIFGKTFLRIPREDKQPPLYMYIGEIDSTDPKFLAEVFKIIKNFHVLKGVDITTL